ncbi:tRNA (uridine(54)-C5)-methyltransferase TrmA [Pseudoteredinibacter isoporae]|uniref:tRNA/tmRNA (uracil-C(5))-methyltransferase n=1 Tax=Pseudoteredinibacter isoporae TaxID=570281 RepID=A0A7X0JTR6_9GAMM|nr:tRNA (uridine(54)-C5)-methyltransferase TrmA [Pseudoteredinibacter isoporae]MBB6521977.1 tRNA (uracil-5-)-methyltransferase [Pseudoteredinibacter isoporae]NHO87513.1 tRNA (uridine(54)-C5)-methyltransferase TrmA [Pseudoteredinibacter isoporae]NIB24156.1 tRNA (uridine(54)-C5)-methyltransferase TrmA [Pseudoteredinibacter isoporae]
MSVHLVHPERYQEQLLEKQQRIEADFAPFDIPNVEVFPSEPAHYRQRAEFKAWHEGDQLHYAMYAQGEYKKPYIIDRFPVASEYLNDLMAALLPKLNASELLKRKLFQIEFLCTQAGDGLITLIYHKALDEQWQKEAMQLQEALGCSIMGRSKKQKLVLSRDHVFETLNIHGKAFRYQQVESSFTQPNAGICEKMIEWAMDCCRESQGHLIELYCGNGNFTIPLAQCFDKVLATEISKTSVKSAQENMRLNNTDNIQIARMSAEEFSQAMAGVRSFRRLEGIDLSSYELSTVLVDPPRAGLDEDTEKMVAGFDNILYISCNPETLAQNLNTLCKSHKVERFALFDQFPYTHHIECGVWLSKR